MSIIFKDREGIGYFSLTNFKAKDSNYSFIEYEFYFNNDGFEAKAVLEAELFDLKNLLKGLSLLNDSLIGSFSFEPIVSGRIKILFKINDQGHLAINGSVYDTSYLTSLSFEFLSDQTFLPDLISQCTKAIDSLKED